MHQNDFGAKNFLKIGDRAGAPSRFQQTLAELASQTTSNQHLTSQNPSKSGLASLASVSSHPSGSKKVPDVSNSTQFHPIQILAHGVLPVPWQNLYTSQQV
jgi:hypothetical protein